MAKKATAKASALDDLFETETETPTPKGKKGRPTKAAAAEPTPAPALRRKTAKASPPPEPEAPARKGKGKAKAMPREEALTAGPIVGRAPGEVRGIPGFNANQVLRQYFSHAKGRTSASAVAHLSEQTTGARMADGSSYPEALVIGRVKKFLAGYGKRGEIEVLGENRDGESVYRFTGEVTVRRGREPQEEAVPATPPPAVKKGKKAKATA